MRLPDRRKDQILPADTGAARCGSGPGSVHKGLKTGETLTRSMFRFVVGPSRVADTSRQVEEASLAFFIDEVYRQKDAVLRNDTPEEMSLAKIVAGTWDPRSRREGWESAVCVLKM